ncbi:hypothetical protein E0G74_01395 [Salmonella enterica]|nr:hypothetical protein [Salmonella enterica]EGD6457193.1 hypothetical protein [Salmonella enterica]
MPQNTADLKSLDYFELLRLDGKRAVYDLDGNKSAVICEGVSYTLDTTKMTYRNVDMKKVAEGFANPEISAPLSAGELKLHEHGVLKLFNLKDQYWLLVFMAPPKTACLLRVGSFEETLGAL